LRLEIVPAGSEAPLWTADLPVADPAAIEILRGPGDRLSLSVPAPAEARTSLLADPPGATLAASAPLRSDGRAGFSLELAGDLRSLAVDVEGAPGVVARYHVPETVVRAARLSSALSRFDPAPLVRKLVAPGSGYDPDRNYLPMAPMVALSSLVDPRRGLLRPPGGEGHWLARIRDELAKRGLLGDLDPLDRERDRLFAAGTLPRWLASELYEGLLRLQALDLVVLAQHDRKRLDVARLHAGHVRVRHRLPARCPPPEAVWICEQPTAWLHREAFDSGVIGAWIDTFVHFTQAFPDDGGSRAGGLARVFLEKRDFPVKRVDARVASGPARLRLEVALLGPAFAFDIELVPAGKKRGFRVLAAQPGLDSWLVVMDGWARGAASVLGAEDRLEPRACTGPDRPRDAASVSGAPDDQELEWGEIEIDLPPGAVPRPPFDVVVTYRCPPGVPVRSVCTKPRTAFARRIALVPGGG
jgi:hypothetical protein